MKMNHFFIISGGMIDDAFACRMIKEENPQTIIAADSGMECLYRCGIVPHVIVGDFDSVSGEALAYFREQKNIRLEQLNPVKDDTDTEFAIRLAVSMGAQKITLLGATGSRLDHVLGNIELLGIGLSEQVQMELVDTHNRIRMINQSISIKKAEQFGDYVSLIPYTQEVTHLFLEGFKYPLSDYCLKGFCSIGISNEIIEEEAFITFAEGILLVVEARDGEPVM